MSGNNDVLLEKLKSELDDLKKQIENDNEIEKDMILKLIEGDKAELECIEKQIRHVLDRLTALEKRKEDIANYVKTGKLPNPRRNAKPTNPFP
jgi:hypothetical protein